MLPLSDLFVHVYVLVDDTLADGVVAIPWRPGPSPACSDAEVLTVALVRHLLGRPSEAGFEAENAIPSGTAFLITEDSEEFR